LSGMGRLKRLAISFSGGRTSAVMTKLCVESLKDDYDISVQFANTGCEHEKTLEFVDKCDKHFGFNVNWVEGIFFPGQRKGPRAKVVDFKTASRNGEPFEKYIEKYGLPDRNHPHCTARLKEDVMLAFLRDFKGWRTGSYWTAIGLRADEMDRFSVKSRKKKLYYPLAVSTWTKEDVLRECRRWPFDLELPGEHYGNCLWCWKKSLRKLMTLAKENPTAFDFPVSMEDKHPWTNNSDKYPRVMFRERRSARDIIKMAHETDFEPYSDKRIFDPDLDAGQGCGESCEAFADQ